MGHPPARITMQRDNDAEKASSHRPSDQQTRFRRERDFARAGPRVGQSQRNSGLGGGLGRMKRSSGDGSKR
jgi:hypothetical protein